MLKRRSFPHFVNSTVASMTLAAVLSACAGGAASVPQGDVLPSKSLSLQRMTTDAGSGGQSLFRYYTVPAALFDRARPARIIAANGSLWFTAYRSGQVGEITTSGQITLYQAKREPFGIAAASNGDIWFAEELNIGRIKPDGMVSEFRAAGAYAEDMAYGPDRDLWVTAPGSNSIDRVTQSGASTEFSVPTQYSSPWGITVGPDGNLWFCEQGYFNGEGYTGSKIGRVTPSGVITEFSVPTPYSEPYLITSGPDGNLWFTENQANNIGRISTSGVVTEFPVPTASSSPSDITAGPDGNVWFTEEAGNKLGRVTPAGTITEFPLNRGSRGPFGITTGPDGNLWFTEPFSDRIGVFSLSTIDKAESLNE